MTRNERIDKNPSRVTGHVSRCRGFTLLELLIVLFLAVLMVMLSAVLFTNTLSSSRLNAAAREISASIRHARTLAQIHGERQAVVIDLDAKQYGVEGRALRSIPPDVNIKVTDPFSGDVYSGKYLIAASATGAVNGGAIVLWNKKRTMTIQLDPIVGAVVIK
ncbi:MAG: prepilin-type N-terminal cleavage/methylation domain-containing protein [Nitrospirae bacterium]|nr:prepilin-type N-terminal cleavage/methylation domain-containing protein [Nitrospirota bacterium]MCL5421333.1 prepilin-type N-terminal cleavage/methylation domain-containing protein [Nitrospirota bacterium]